MTGRVRSLKGWNRKAGQHPHDLKTVAEGGRRKLHIGPDHGH
ncbi:hypothetical protein O206_17005 [Ochrobactrum sp. EGD-AQ16]|nr:hypothetical protein O206_17005 [Ochrobactrum sp. EGD-AQ16]